MRNHNLQNTMQANIPFPTVAPNSRQILLPSIISSVHGMICRRTRLVLYTRNGKVFWKIMPYYNPPATKSQRLCRDAFGEANRYTAADIKHYTLYWTKMAEIKHYNSAHQAAFNHFYDKAKAEIKKLNRIINNAKKRIRRTLISSPCRYTSATLTLTFLTQATSLYTTLEHPQVRQEVAMPTLII